MYNRVRGKDMDRKYEFIAVDKVIEYAMQQGIKLRRGDFALSSRSQNNYGMLNIIYGDMHFLNGETGVNVILRPVNRWKNLLNQKKELFLNYSNARLIKGEIVFQFSYRELDLFELKNGADSNEKIEKIISRVNRLLALADLEKNPSEQEAIAASMKVQELLAKYNLDIADVTGEEKEEEIEHVCADIKGKGTIKWRALLANAVAESYRCKSYRFGSNRYIFFGFKSDAVIARRVFIYLINVCDKLGKSYVAEKKKKGYDTSGSLSSFYTGFYTGVKSALERNCTALALVVPQKVESDFEDQVLSTATRTTATLKSYDSEAYQTGVTEGKLSLIHI